MGKRTVKHLSPASVLIIVVTYLCVVIYSSVIGSIMSLSHSNNDAGAITAHFLCVLIIGGLQGWRGAGM